MPNKFRNIIEESINFTDSKVKESYSDYRINAIRANWDHCRFPLYFYHIVVFSVEYFKNEFKDTENVVWGIGALALLAFYHFLWFYVMKSTFLTKYGGIILLLVYNVYMTEIVVQNGEYKIYAGFPAMIAIEFYYAIHHVSDIWLFPLTTFVGHSYCLIRFYTCLDDVSEIFIPCMYAPVIMQCFTCYTFNMHRKKDFLCMFTQKATIDKFYNLLNAFPERIVITQTKWLQSEQGTTSIRLICSTLHRCQNMLHEWRGHHPDASTEWPRSPWNHLRRVSCFLWLCSKNGRRHPDCRLNI